MSLRFMMQSFRFRSSAASNLFTEEELHAILELRRRTEQPLSKTAENVMRTRSWAKSPVLEVSGKKPPVNWNKVGKKGQRFNDEEEVEQSIVKLRWANFSERDVDILLSPGETLYTVEVKAVLYGIIQAIRWNETKIRMKSCNEVVVKVANKKYTASKESASFHLITRVVNATDTKSRENQLKAKLDSITEPDKPIRRMAQKVMTENDFFNEYRDSINKLKSYN
ncbi:hypothetical protein GCK72_005542 [Caenorhabditis remanei]|uniref:Uncharacterized protein n=1 Tax=Caenorhabditis remanei TaxID=31234 RepID=E3LFT7_CAERE|nr:hypothetical protein GCK72_005542 [Caenorhabditis remanei]EFO86031.1 hypothetical protein CRE_02236 [Caenorhabditis remanei]KAF1765590.1 hypothetical protein GCK72_005542 [Caenorhabditis remanei]